MSGAYTPREGSIAARVIEHLGTLEAGTMLAAGELADALGVRVNGLSTSLNTAVREGALVSERQGRFNRFGLPVEPDADALLAITSDNKGDLWFTGAVVHEDGMVMLSPKQLDQLVTYATTSPLRHGAPKNNGVDLP